MITTLGSAATATVIQRITAPSGMNSMLGALTAPDSSLAKPVSVGQVRAQNVAGELAERSQTMTYPSLNVYCEKIANTLKEKFRSFSVASR